MASSGRHTAGRAALIALVVALVVVAAVSTFASDGSEGASAAPFSFETAALASLGIVLVLSAGYYGIRAARRQKG